jgi:arginyl-tRNA synthetase
VIERRLVDLLSQALAAAAPGLGISGELPTPELLAPKQRDHGDFATNVALGLAKRTGMPPRDVAQAIVDALPAASFLEKAEVAGPGFLNLFTTDEWLHDALREVVADGPEY